MKYVCENSIPYHQTRGTKDLSEIKDIFDDEHHNWVSNTSGASVVDNAKTNELFKKDSGVGTENVNKKDKKKDERKKKNVKFSNNNAKTDMSVCNIENVNLNQKDKINIGDYRARERIERRDRGMNYNLNKNDCSMSNKSPNNVGKESKLKLMRSKTERNYKE